MNYKYIELMKYYGMTYNSFFNLPKIYQKLLIDRYIYVIENKKTLKKTVDSNEVGYNFDDVIKREVLRYEKVKSLIKR